MSSSPQVHILPVTGIPEVKSGDDVALHIATALQESGLALESGDVLVVAHKIVSKAEGRVQLLSEVVPSPLACSWASRWEKDARLVEVVLRESRRLVRMENGILISETHQGQVCANAGVDNSNVQEESVVLLPEDPDASAGEIRERLEELLGVDVAVLISDSFGRPWRVGQINVAIGVSGMQAVTDYRGTLDSFRQRLQASIMASADELASAAELVMGKSDGIPVALVRGFEFEAGEGRGDDLLRSPESDLFR